MSIDQIRTAIAPVRESLLNHPLYGCIDRPAALGVFMQHHVFAVWDFMSLLKALQARLTCVSIPWVPAVDAAAARLVNEIVLGEETDEDGQGGFASHFELYRRAMVDLGIATAAIDRFLKALGRGETLDRALLSAGASDSIRRFVEDTFAEISSNDLCRIASVFAFGREDLLPDVFQQIVEALDAETGGRLARFKYYLRRHIDLDGGEHGPMAARLVERACAGDAGKWSAARGAAVRALNARLALWDEVHRQIAR